MSGTASLPRKGECPTHGQTDFGSLSGDCLECEAAQTITAGMDDHPELAAAYRHIATATTILRRHRPDAAEPAQDRLYEALAALDTAWRKVEAAAAYEEFDRALETDECGAALLRPGEPCDLPAGHAGHHIRWGE